ncbi:MAG: hypothetical protein ACP5IA_08695 [Sediminispirochaetaceae bacterium]
MKRKRLSKKEIDDKIQQIRSAYDDYMVRFIKNSSAREAFERRYREALATRIELDRFLEVELKVAQEMCAREEKRLRKAEELAWSRNGRGNGANGNGAGGPRGPGNGNANGEKEPQGDFADRYIEKLKQRAEKYPVAGLESGEVWEVDHLYGALQKLEREIWPPVDRVYRKIYPSRYDGPRITLENKLMELAEARMGGVPQVLHTLQMLLGRFPRNYREIEWEIKQTILKASFFLHDAKGELEKLLHESYLADSERIAAKTAHEYIEGVIADFRLKDLKQK